MKFLASALAGCSALGLVHSLKIENTVSMSPIGRAGRAAKLSYWEKREVSGLRMASVRQEPATCVEGSVTIAGEAYDCDGIDFQSFLSLADATIPTSGGTSGGSDIWGWLSPEGKEITLWTVDNGIWFVDTTDPGNPLRLGYMSADRGRTGWSDVKVFKDTAYFVKDSGSSSTGIQVFDLNRLAGLGDDPTRSFDADFTYTEHTNSHNVLIDTDSGFLYSVGTDTCAGGLHMIDINTPLEPTFVGCASSDGYTHDAQCVVYDGPDTRYTGSQICFAFNEDTITIWDVTDKSNPVILGRQGYATAQYTHQGWATDDLKYVLMNDELDEYYDVQEQTSTYVVDIQDLENPALVFTYTHDMVSIDHNLYFWGSLHKRGFTGGAPLESYPNINYAYLSNYVSGLRVLDVTDIAGISLIGYFDISPDKSGNVFDGAWSSYLHPSGNIAVSSIDRGLYVLTPRMVFDEEQTLSPGAEPTGFPTFPPVPTPTTPDGWICPGSYYDVLDGCDCECGAPDPDCEDLTQTPYGCSSTANCIDGVCLDTVAPTSSGTGTPTFTETDAPTNGAEPTDAPTDDGSGGIPPGGPIDENFLLVAIALAVVVVLLLIAIIVVMARSPTAAKVEEVEVKTSKNLAYGGPVGEEAEKIVKL